MWLQKNTHSGPCAEHFTKDKIQFTKVGFPLRFYQRLRTGCEEQAQAADNYQQPSCAGTTNEAAAPAVPVQRRPRGAQFINHFPGSECLDNKARMAACISEAARKHPEAYQTGYAAQSPTHILLLLRRH